MKSHQMIVKTLSEHIIVAKFACLSEKYGFWTKIVSYLKMTGLLQKRQ